MMILVEKHIIKKSNSFYDELDALCFLSKNLYNAGLFSVRQYFFENNKFLNYISLQRKFQKENNIDFRALPSKVSQQTLKLVELNFKSFFTLLKKKESNNYDKKVRIPKYLKKDGKQVVIYTNQAISKVELKKGYIKLSKTSVKIPTKVKNVQQVRVVPKNGYIVVEVLYNVECKPLRKDNNRYASIDLGVNNLATIGSNVIKPIIVNGKPIKSINQYFNKRVSKLKSKLENNKGTSKRIKSITLKRHNKIDDYLHKASRYVVNHLVSNNINTLIVGRNKGWKQDINIGKQNNQKFVSIPFEKFVSLIKYKCELEGINYIEQEESYTSKCSFLDGEDVGKHPNYLGKRVKRGLFKSSKGKLTNADLNGTLNILRKVVGDFSYPIEVCSTPTVYTVKFN